MNGTSDIREHLPNRRPSFTRVIEWRNASYLLGFGLDPKTLMVREIFLDGPKSGSDVEGILDDACILLSRLLQSGDDAAGLVRRVCSGGKADSVLGYVLRLAAQEEADACAGPTRNTERALWYSSQGSQAQHSARTEEASGGR